MSALTPVRNALSRAARHVLWQIAGAALVAYFAYHAIQGDRGILTMSRLQGEIEQARVVLDKVRSERQELEHRTNLLRPESLDPDLLDERARAVLNYSHPDDVTIILPRPEGDGAQGAPGAKP